MATPINNWPFTDLHNQNLDWVIQTVKNLQEEVREFTEDLPHVSAWNNGTWDITHAYDANEIVFDDNKMYLSVKPVPANTQISNTTYWTEIADMGFDPSAIYADIAALDAALQAALGDVYYVTPEDFGAVRDGTTDCSAAFQAALNTGKVVKLLLGPNGYVIKNPVLITAVTAKLVGPDATWNQTPGQFSGITLTDNGYFIVNAEYALFQNIYFYSYNRTQGSRSAVTINGPDGLNGDAFFYNCVFSSCDDSIICNARGLDVVDCLFARGTPAITLNYVGTTTNPTPITDSRITGGRGFNIQNCRFHTGVTWSVLVPAGASCYNFNYQNNLSDHSYGEIVIYGSVSNANIDGNTWTLCNRPVLAVADGKLYNSVFSNNVCSANQANALPDNYISITGSDAEIENVSIIGNGFHTSAYRAILATGLTHFTRVIIANNSFDNLNITGNNITYAAINLPGTFDTVAITGNVFGQVAPIDVGCCIRADTEDSTGSHSKLVVQNNIKTYDKDYLVHASLQADATDSDIQTYRLNP